MNTGADERSRTPDLLITNANTAIVVSKLLALFFFICHNIATLKRK